MKSAYRAPHGQLPDAYRTVQDLHYVPADLGGLDRCTLLVDDMGTFHYQHDCRADLQVTDRLPTVGEWLGATPGICFCVPVTDPIQDARTVTRLHYQFPTLPQKLTGTNTVAVAAFAQQLMRARRHLDKLPDQLQAITGGGGILERATSHAVDELKERSLHTATQISELIEDPGTREHLDRLSPDNLPVLAALDNYQYHLEQTTSVDGDLADVATLVYGIARSGERVALRAPRGLVQFIALHRRGGGFTEADRNPVDDPKTIETALVLWEPDSSSSYRRWSAALEAATLIHRAL